MVDLQDRVLLDHAEQHQHAERRVEVERLTREQQRQQRERRRERQRQQDHERLHHALELRREDHVHEQHGQQEGDDELGEGLLEFLRAARDGGAVLRPHAELVGRCAQHTDAFAEGVARGDRAAQAVLALAVEAVDARGALRRHDLDEVVEADRRARASRHHQPPELVDVGAIDLLQPQAHVVLLVEHRVTEAAHLTVAADHQPQRERHVLDVDAEFRGALAIDLHAQLGLGEAQRRVEVLHAAQLARPFLEAAAVVVQGREVRAADGEVDVEVAAADVEAALVAHGATQVGELAQAAPDLAHHVALRVVAAECGEWISGQRAVDEPAHREAALLVWFDAHVERAAADATEEPAAGLGEDRDDAGDLAHLGFDRAHRLVHRLVADLIRAADAHVEFAFVDVGGDVVLLHERVELHRRAGHGERHEQRQHGVAERLAQEPQVGAFADAGAIAVHRRHRVGVQPAGAEHRRE